MHAVNIVVSWELDVKVFGVPWLYILAWRYPHIVCHNSNKYEGQSNGILSCVIGHALHKAEMEYHGSFGHALGRIQHIDIMSRIDRCYTTFILATQTVAPTLPGFQGIKRCVI